MWQSCLGTRLLLQHEHQHLLNIPSCRHLPSEEAAHSISNQMHERAQRASVHPVFST